MSKAVRWQVPFVSVSGTKYRVDIYDDTGSWSGVTQLLPGDQPFVTDEDASDDYFAPVRSQSGTLQVCTYIEPQTTYPSGGTLSLNDILPANNIAHPVRLVSIAANNAETIEWQGFLSCEAYNQDYVGIPQNISLPLISVLEAMASVQLNINTTTGIKQAYHHIYDVLHEIDVQTGITNFTHVRYSMTDWNIFLQYIDSASFYDVKECINEEAIVYTTVGISCKDVIERLARFMGWVVRENKTEIILERIGESNGMYKQTLSDFGTNFHADGTPYELLTVQSLATDFTNKWRGTGHQKSISAGAKSVEVVAQLEEYDAESKLPVCPDNSLENKTRQLRDDDYVSAYICKNDLFYNGVCIFNYYPATLIYTGLFNKRQQACTLDDVISRCALCYGLVTSSPDADTPYQFKYMGAFLARIGIGSSVAAIDQYTTGLYISGMMDQSGESVAEQSSHKFELGNEVFILKSSRSFTLSNGKLKLKITSKMFSDCNADGPYGKCNYIDFKPYNQLYVYVKYGNKYGHSRLRTWSETFQYFSIYHDNNTFEAELPITDEISGYISIGVFGTTNHLNGSLSFDMYDLFITEMEIAYEPNVNGYMSDSGENKYYRLLGTNFRDEISLETEFASSVYNKPSPSLIMSEADKTVPITTIPYVMNVVSENRRPEVDLLNRLAAYYGVARQRLELEVAHPTAAPLPLIILKDIEYDTNGKIYIPLSESRDWQTEVSKLTCFDTAIQAIRPPDPEPVSGEIDLTDPSFTYNGFRLDIISGEIQDVEQNISGAKLYIKQIILEQAGAISLQSSAASSGIFIYYDLGDVADLMEALETNDTEWLNDDVVHLIGEASGASGTASYNLQAGNYMLLYQGSVTATFTPSN